MNESTKSLILLTLETLRRVNVENGISMGFDKTNNLLMFFDTKEYITSGKLKGFNVSLESLVEEKQKVINVKKKFVRVGASASVNRCLYETEDRVKTHMENEIGYNIGKYIVENKEESPIRFKEVKNEYSVTLLGDVMLVDSELRHIVELIVECEDLSKIMYYIQEYKMKEQRLI